LGDLAAPACEAVAAHVQRCQLCAERLAGLDDRTDPYIAGLRKIPPPELEVVLGWAALRLARRADDHIDSDSQKPPSGRRPGLAVGLARKEPLDRTRGHPLDRILFEEHVPGVRDPLATNCLSCSTE
jgi:hypothetical protein